MTISSLATGRMIDVNESFLKLSGFHIEEVIGHTAAELRLWKEEGDRERVIAILRTRPVRNMQARLRTKSGKLFHVMFSAEIVNFGGEECLLAVSLDVTEQKR